MDIEIHQEDNEAREDDQEIENNVKEESRMRNKRPFEKLPPIKETKENIKRSVEPKIQRNQNNLTKKKSRL